ncbi:MAG: glycosyltransferase [Lachnospiraceae bacterium]
MKKILHVCESFGGGVFSFLKDLCNEQVASYDVTIFYARREQTPDNFESMFPNEVNFIESIYLKKEINPLNELKARSEMKNIINNIKPDIIHLHSSKAGIIGRTIKTKKIKKFYTPHGFSFLKQDDSKIKRIIYKGIEKITSFSNCTITCCSKGEYEVAKSLTKKAALVNNGINVKELDELLNKIKQKKRKELTVGTISRIGYQKNPKLFNKIALANPQINFIWIGDGELRHELTSSNIEIRGWLKRDEAIKELMQCDVFLLPSLWEGLPISLLEAMYIQKVCLVSNVVGNRDVINRENGFICNELNEYNKVLSGLEDNIFDIKQLTSNAYSDVLKNYTSVVMAEEYKKLYEENFK